MTNPFADLIPAGRGGAIDDPDNPFLDLIAENGRSAFSNFGRGVGSGFTTAFQSAAEGALWAGDKLLPGEPLTGLRDDIQDAKQRTREFFDPEGTAGFVGEIGGAIVGEGAQSVLGGVKLGSALMRLGRGTSAASRAVRPVASAIEAGRAGSFGQRVVANAAPFAPIDVVLGAGAADPEGDADWLPGKGRVEGAVLSAGAGLLGAGVVEGGVSAARRLRRPARDLTSQADEAMRRAAEQADQTPAPTSEQSSVRLLTAGDPEPMPMPGEIAPEEIVRRGEREAMVTRAEREAVDARLSEFTRKHPEEVQALDDEGLAALRAELLEQVRNPRTARPHVLERRVAAMEEPIADQESVRRALLASSGRQGRPAVQPLSVDGMADDATRAPVVDTPPAAEPSSPPPIDVNRSQIAGQLRDTTGRALGPDDEITVYHATDRATADRLLREGARVGAKTQRPPTIIEDETLAATLRKRVGEPLDYEPGRGQGQGFYVGPDPRHLSQFGDAVVGVRVRVRDLAVPPERAASGRVGPAESLLLNDGYIAADIPASAMFDATGANPLPAARFAGSTDDALQRAASPPESVPPAIPREDVPVRRAFKKATDDDLVTQLSDSIERLEKEGEVAASGLWTRENEYAQVISGNTFSSGRAKVQAKYAQKRIQEIETEFRSRGYSDDDIENALLSYQERRAEREGQALIDRQWETARNIGLRTESAGEIGGALVGGVLGANVAPEGREGQGFLAGAAAGVGLGYLARRMEAAAVRPKSTKGLTPETRRVLQSVSDGEKVAPRTEITQLARKAYTQVVDSTYPIRRFLKGAGESVADVVRATGWKGAAELRVRTDLGNVMEMAKGHEPQVVALATARRALELASQGLANKGVDLTAAAKAERVLSAIPEVRKAADALRDYYRALLDSKLQAGVIAQSDYDALVNKGQFYVPFVRDFTDEVMRSGGQGLVQRTKTIRRMTEEDAVSKIRNPFEQAVIDTFITERAIARQRVTNVVAAVYDSNPSFARNFLKEIGAGDKAAAHRVEVNHGGKRRVFDVIDDDLYESWASMAPVAEDIMVSVLGKAKAVLQAGVTHFPAFGVANAARDLTMTAIQYPVNKRSLAAGAIGGAAVGAATSDDPLTGALVGAGLGGAGGVMAPHLARTVRALGDIIAAKSIDAPPGVRQALAKLGDGKMYEEWLREGGSGFGFFARTPLDAQRMTRELIERGQIHPSRILNPKSVWDALATVNKAVEEAPRLARYKHARAAGASKPDAVAESRDISLDFSRHGSSGGVKFLAGSVAFLNPKIQGWDKLVRMLKNPKTAGVAALTITAPSVALWFVNKDNPEYWNTSQTTRNLFWLVPDGDDGFYYVPKPFELGYIFGSAPERLLDFMQHRNPELLKYAGREMLGNAIGGLPIPTAVLPTMEANIGEGGHQFFFDRPVVPENLQGLPSEMQQDDRTSFVASAAGGALGISPKKIDHVIRGQTGSVGGYLNDRLTDVAQATGLDRRERPAFERPGLMSRFHSREDTQPEPVSALYRRMSKLEKVARGFDVAAQQGEQAIARFQERHGAELDAYYNAVGLFEAMKELQATRRLIQTDTSLSADDRRAQLSTIREEMAALASEALKAVQ